MGLLQVVPQVAPLAALPVVLQAEVLPADIQDLLRDHKLAGRVVQSQQAAQPMSAAR